VGFVEYEAPGRKVYLASVPNDDSAVRDTEPETLGSPR